MEKPSFLDLFKQFKRKVDEYIFERLPLDHDIPEIELLYRMMRDYPSRAGKGLRPGLLMADDGPQQGGLAASARAQKGEDLICRNSQIDVRQGFDPLTLGKKILAQVVDADLHKLLPRRS